MKYKILSLDETGKAHYNHSSKHFILSGYTVKEEHEKTVEEMVSKIVFKYFGTRKIVLHASDMFSHKRDFLKLREEKTEKSFWKDIAKHVLRKSYVLFSIIVVDKEKAKRKNWLTKTILTRSYKKILENFASNLKKTNYLGKIISESSTDQDQLLVQAHSILQCSGVRGVVTGKEYFQKITSLALVTKKNHSVGTQLADIMATAGRIESLLRVEKMIKKEVKDPVKLEKELSKIPSTRWVEEFLHNEFMKRVKNKNDPCEIVFLI